MVTGDITKMVTQVIPDFAPRHKNKYTRKRPLREFWNTKGRLKHPSAPPLPLALVPPVGKTARVASKLPNIVGHVLGAPAWVWPHQDFRGSAELDHWQSNHERRGRRGCNNQLSDLGSPSSYLQCPSSGPNLWLIHLQKSVSDVV